MIITFRPKVGQAFLPVQDPKPRTWTLKLRLRAVTQVVQSSTFRLFPLYTQGQAGMPTQPNAQRGMFSTTALLLVYMRRVRG